MLGWVQALKFGPIPKIRILWKQGKLNKSKFHATFYNTKSGAHHTHFKSDFALPVQVFALWVRLMRSIFYIYHTYSTFNIRFSSILLTNSSFSNQLWCYRSLLLVFLVQLRIGKGFLWRKFKDWPLGPNVGRKFKGLSLWRDLARHQVMTCGGQTLLPQLITEFTVCSLLQNISTEYFMQTYAAHEEDRLDFKQIVCS